MHRVPGSLAPLWLAALLACVGCSEPPPPDLIVVCLDTLRADAVPAWGSPHARTPGLDRLARRGTLFADCRTPSPWTLPAHGTLFSGLLPQDHGLEWADRSLPGGIPWLPEALQRAGYRTAAFVGGGYVSARHGMDRGFQVFQELQDRSAATDETFRLGLRWLDETPGKPRFLFLHTYEVHNYFQAVPSHLRRLPSHPGVAPDLRDANLLPVLTSPRNQHMAPADMEYVRGRYRAALEQTDRSVEGLLCELDRRSFWEGGMLILLSDHGEGFGEHQAFHHGTVLFDEEARVPLLMEGRGVPAGRILETPFSLRDVPELLAAQSDLDFGRSGRGIELRALLEHDRAPREEPRLAEEVRYGLFSRILGSWKLLLEPRRGGWLWFDLDGDPRESQPRAAGPPDGDRWKGILLERLFSIYRGRLVIMVRSAGWGGRLEGTIRQVDAGEARIELPEPEDRLEGGKGEQHFRLSLRKSWRIVSLRPGRQELSLELHLEEPPMGGFVPEVFLGSRQEPWDGSERISFQRLLLDPEKTMGWDFERTGAFLAWIPPAEGAVPARLASLPEDRLEELRALGYVELESGPEPAGSGGQGTSGGECELRLNVTVRRLPPESEIPLLEQRQEPTPAAEIGS